MATRSKTPALANSDRDGEIAQIIALHQSQARLQLMLDAVPAMLTFVDAEQRYLYSNEPYLRLFDLEREQIVSHHMKDVLGDDLYRSILPHITQALAGIEVQYERQHRRDDGTTLDLSVTFVPHRDATGDVDGVFCLTLDVTRVKTLERELAHLARHDALTGLPNRATFAAQLNHAIERHRRYRTPLAVAYLDVDKFKSINDTLGHGAGDLLLCEFAARLRKCVRASDMVARLGGDEFVLLIDSPIDAAGAACVAQKILQVMQPDFALRDRRIQIATSIGVALATKTDGSGEDVVAFADAALYEAKGQGGNRFVLSEMA